MVAHNATGAAPAINGSLAATPAITIPSVAVTQADGTALKAAIAAGPKTGGIKKNPAHTGIRDGDLENGIIIHEYGHGISSRLTGGVGNSCLGGNEQAGEGWSDYLALTFTMDPTVDNPDVGRGMGPYALFQGDRNGAGIRPRPYSRNMEIQPFTYDSIKTGGWLNGASLALPHGLGHGWASVLWDLNWDLIDKYGYNRELYQAWNTGGNNRALQYVMDGLKLQGCNPGLVVASRAIIAAAEAPQQRPADKCTRVGDVRPPRPRLQRRPGHHRPRRQLGGVRHASGLPARLRERATRAGDHHRGVGHGGPAQIQGRRRLDAGSTSPPRTTRTRARSTARRGRRSPRARSRSRRVRSRWPRSRRPARRCRSTRPARTPTRGRRRRPGATRAVSSCSRRRRASSIARTSSSWPRRTSTPRWAARSPATLGLTLGTNASFAPFVPGVAREYTAHTSANVISTAGDAALSVSDPGRLMNGAFSLAEPLQVSFSKSAWTAPVSNDVVDIAFKQLIKANDPLRTGTYSKTLTFTLSTTNP